jgi:hypothetical protein
MQERVVCSISAAVKYEVPVNIILAVAEKEAGKPGQWVSQPPTPTASVTSYVPRKLVISGEP